MKSPKLKPMHQPGDSDLAASASSGAKGDANKGAAKAGRQPSTKAVPSSKAKAKATTHAKPKAKAAPKRKAADIDDDDDGEEHPPVRVVVGNTAKFLREEVL